MRYERGFTLVELLITLVIAAIVIAIAVPNFTRLVRDNSATSHANELVSALNTARSEAVARSAPVTLCASNNSQANSPSCNTDWAAGWVAYEDDNGNQTIDGTDQVVRVWDALPADLGLKKTNGSPQGVTYNSRGAVSTQTTFVLQPDSCPGTGAPVRTIQINLVGRSGVARGTC